VPISGSRRTTGLILPGAEGPRTAYVAVQHFETDGNASLRINFESVLYLVHDRLRAVFAARVALDPVDGLQLSILPPRNSRP
jgi:hypothetical protein